MSERPAIYRTHGGKVLHAAFPSRPAMLDGDDAQGLYRVEGETGSTAAHDRVITRIVSGGMWPGRAWIVELLRWAATARLRGSE